MFKEGDDLGVFFVERFRDLAGCRRERRTGGGLGFARGEAETRVGLFAATCRFVEDGAVDFGD